MRFTLPLVFILLILCSQNVAHAQQKIGYTNLDLILAYLPETQQVQYEIENFQKQVTKKLEAKKKYFDVKVEEYTEMAQQPGVTPAALAPLEKELEKLQEELRKSVEKSDRDLARKQSELMEPVIEKLEKELKGLAEEHGYTFILNSATNGSSIVLHAADSYDVSELLFERLGVEIPKD